MGRSRGMGAHSASKITKKYKTKKRAKDLDQIWDDTREGKIERTRTETTAYDEDKPGLGQFYCISCSKYFVNDGALAEHFKSKLHKKRYVLLYHNVGNFKIFPLNIQNNREHCRF